MSDTQSMFRLAFDVLQKEAPELRPIQFNATDPASIDAVLSCVTAEHALLDPRIETLETTLSEKKLNSKPYQESKIRPNWTFELTSRPALPGPLPIETPSRRRPASDFKVPQTETTEEAVSRAFAHPRSILVIGTPSAGGTLETHFGMRAAFSDIRVTRGSEPVPEAETPENNPERPRWRPRTGSFEDWLSLSGETERSALSAYCFTVDAEPKDIALLHGRMAPGQVIIAEHGSVAVAWLDVEWRGTIHRHQGINIYSEPCHLFRAPDQPLTDKQDWPKISVVTVSYNQAQFLEECIQSVLGQDYPNLEYIVIDACSNDGSVDILERYRDQIDVLVIEPDEGQSDGLNKGFNLATGDILTWINSDDALAPLALRRAAQAFKSSGADIVAGTCERVAEQSSTLIHRHYSNIPTNTKQRLHPEYVVDWSHCWEKGDYFFQPEVLFSKDVWLRSGGAIKRHLHWAMDWDLWVRMAFAGATVYRIPDVIGISRVQDQQKTQADEAYLPQVQGLLDEYRQMLEKLSGMVSDATNPQGLKK